jgi:cytochrome c556
MDTKEVTQIKLSHLYNTEHYLLGSDFLTVVTPELAENFNFSEVRERCRMIHEKEDKVLMVNQQSLQTEEIRALDKVRDKRLSDFKATVTFYLRTGTEAQREAAQLLDHLLKPSRNAARKSYVENTSELGKFVDDVKGERYAQPLARLGLTAAVPALEAANNAFYDLLQSRSEKRLEQASHEKMPPLRVWFDRNYRFITNILSVLYYVEADPLRKQQLGTAIDEINASVEILRKTLKRRGISSKTLPLGDEISEEPNS